MSRTVNRTDEPRCFLLPLVLPRGCDSSSTSLRRRRGRSPSSSSPADRRDRAVFGRGASSSSRREWAALADFADFDGRSCSSSGSSMCRATNGSSHFLHLTFLPRTVSGAVRRASQLGQMVVKGMASPGWSSEIVPDRDGRCEPRAFPAVSRSAKTAVVPQPFEVVMSSPYQIVVGLEVHVQLLTKSKLFCGCSTKFGAPPNSQVCPVCLGMPGVLPVMNRHAFDLALRAALALNCQIAKFTKWDRKNYYYPDLPKNYQISQYDLPFSSEGWLEINAATDPKKEYKPKRIGIIRAHLEEDAGKNLHDESGKGGDSKIDLNRTGTPPLQNVSKPES